MRFAGPLPKILFAGLTLLLAASSGCKGRPPAGHPASDPTASFRPRGEASRIELGIYQAGARVGTVDRTVLEGSWAGLLLGDALLFDERARITVGYQTQRFTIETTTRTAVRKKDQSLLASWTSASFGGAPWVVSWERATEDLFRRKETAGGATRVENIQLPGDLLILETLPSLLGRMDLSPGESRNLDLFSLALRKPVSVKVTLQGESTGRRTFTFTLWAMEEKVWIDEEGRIIQESLPFGLEARLPGREELNGVVRLETILSQTAIPGGNTPERVADFPRAHYILEGVGALPVATPWQKVSAVKRGADLRLTRPSPPEGGGMIPPIQLGREAVLDLDSPYIQQIARQASAGEVTPWGKALAVGRWVHANMGKTMRECTSALDALRAGEGECQSHAVLASSMCQSLGIPTRFVSGVVYLPQRGNWFFHAWFEVNVGEWIPLDPTLGEFPAGVGHIALIYGDYLDQFQMAPFVFFNQPWRVVYEAEETPDSRLGARP